MSLLKFFPKTPSLRRPVGPTVKYGLYPIGEDVIMSKSTLEVVIHLLIHGTPEDQRELSATLRRMHDAVYTGVLVPDDNVS